MTTVTNVRARDIRFPTSQTLAGSDAMNLAPDYSAAYVTLETDGGQLAGDGITFTIGRGNELCKAAIDALAPLVQGYSVERFAESPAAFYRHVTGDSQLRWVGPEKGVIHLATAAIVNAMWDLYAKSVGKPLWRLISEMSPAEFVNCIDFRYLTDVLTPADALSMLESLADTKPQRIKQLEQTGFPSYTTSAGWLGYTDEQLRGLCREMLSRGWTRFKIKVGADLEDDIRRCRILREEIGPDRLLMMDANQVWDVPTAIAHMEKLAEFNPWFIEEPTSPDDILGHAAISQAVSPIRVATGEHCHNRVMFKQFLQAGGMQVCQIDSCRLGGVNEVLAVMLLAAKFNVPVCPHAGGVGLCEYVQHLSMIDFVCISGSLEDRVIEYADHLHEHFLTPVCLKNGHYMPPAAPGYSITMKPESLDEYEYPNGKTWVSGQ